MENEIVGSGRGLARTQEWRSRLAIVVSGLLLFETITGLSIWLLPFSVPNQFAVLLHTAGGLLFLVPYLVYQWRHWKTYRSRSWSHYMLTGYVAFAAVLVNIASGLVLTVQAVIGTAISHLWDMVHIVTTVIILSFAVPHIVLLLVRDRRARDEEGLRVVHAQRRWVFGNASITAAGFVVLVAMPPFYEPVRFTNEFPAGYQTNKEKGPFSPSLARTESGGAFDERSLSGSKSCGTSRCHKEIYDEWSVSAHRWSSMDPAFQVIQEVMAKQNGPTSTRYCGGCHDPISLFAGTKDLQTKDLTNRPGYNEGVSCLVCHSIRETDLKGNASYVIRQPKRYVFELHEGVAARFVSDFLIRAYPKMHVETYSKRLFKTPEYCAACHKQFIDQEVNEVGWVQLQNQYDNWKNSKWNPKDQRDKVIECRECHMPLMDSDDPASGDTLDAYRTADDRKHRDHRFIAANTLIPTLLKLPNAEEHRALTEKWLRGERQIPEIANKWAGGPAVSIAIQSEDTIRPGEEMDIRVVISSNKVGHDFPTGPLDIIQSWIRLEVTDETGRVLLTSGTLDDEHFIKPGAFMFKAEPVDRYGNLIDRHNLWEMVGVRYRRALFPGFTDAATYTVACPTGSTRNLKVRARLEYRKIDQYLLKFVFGADTKLTAPVVTMSEAEKTIRVEAREL